jgi:frataxin-like iron-binding protein CyaY
LQIEGVTIVADDQLNNPGRPSTFAANLAKISIGFIPNEQLHHVLLRLKVPKAVYEQKTPILSAKVTYQQCNGSAKTVEHSQNTFGTVADSIDLNVQLLRLKLINAIDQAMNFMTINAQSEAQNVVNQFQSEIQSWLTLNASKRQHESYKAISDFLADLTGYLFIKCFSEMFSSNLVSCFYFQCRQVSLALSRADWFQKWGRHYLPSLQRAHELQLCNNFKVFC